MLPRDDQLKVSFHQHAARITGMEHLGFNDGSILITHTADCDEHLGLKENPFLPNNPHQTLKNPKNINLPTYTKVRGHAALHLEKQFSNERDSKMTQLLIRPCPL